MATGASAMHVQAVKAVKTLEQARIAPILREGVSRRRLCLEGRMGVDEQPCKAAVTRRIGLSAKYAGKRPREFAGRLFGTQEADIRLRPPTHSPPPSPALAREEPICRS